MSVEKRWEIETPYLISLIRQEFPGLDENSLVIDYGCGIGRLSRELIAQTGCRVVGIDISASMRGLAATYVGSDRFFACAPEMFDRVAAGTTFDLALSVWVLQHTFRPSDDVGRIRKALRVPGGGFFLVNNVQRRVPTKEAVWTDDGVDVRAVVAEAGFAQQAAGSMAAVTSPELAAITYWATYRRQS